MRVKFSKNAMRRVCTNGVQIFIYSMRSQFRLDINSRDDFGLDRYAQLLTLEDIRAELELLLHIWCKMKIRAW